MWLQINSRKHQAIYCESAKLAELVSLIYISQHLFIAGLRGPRLDRVAARRVPHGLLQRRQPRTLDAKLPGGEEGEDDGQDQRRRRSVEGWLQWLPVRGTVTVVHFYMQCCLNNFPLEKGVNISKQHCNEYLFLHLISLGRVSAEIKHPFSPVFS